MFLVCLQKHGGHMSSKECHEQEKIKSNPMKKKTHVTQVACGRKNQRP
jgi:hypothetical protein